MLKITTENQYPDHVRSYKILLDGKNKGNINNNSTFDSILSDGEHSLQLKIDWATSKKNSIYRKR